MEIPEKFLAELLAMARKAVPAKDQCQCCGKNKLAGRRGLCGEHWRLFCRDKKRAAAAVKELTKSEIKRGVTLKQKQQAAAEKWDKLQVALGHVLESHKGNHSTDVSPFVRTA